MYGISDFRPGSRDEGFVSALSLVSAANHRGIGDDMNSKSLNGVANGESDRETWSNGLSNGHSGTAPHRPNGDVQEATEMDLSRVHTIWSLSKDLGCSGLRIVSFQIPSTA